MDGDLVFISSESPERAEETAKDWNCESKFMGDPSNEFAHMHSVKIESRDKSPAKECVSLDGDAVARLWWHAAGCSPCLTFSPLPYVLTPSNKNWDYNKEYPNGFAQPAIIAYYKVRGGGSCRHSRPHCNERHRAPVPLTFRKRPFPPPLCLQEKAVFRWTMKPTKENLDGAADRPVPTDLFAVLRTIVQGKTLEGMQMHPYDSHELKKAEPRLYQSEWRRSATGGGGEMGWMLES